jgi:YD repeat-containing protein
MFETYNYDNAGNLHTRTDFNGRTTTFGYDTLNRLLSKTPDASFNAAPISFTYTATGRRETMTDPSRATSYEYNERDLLKKKITPIGTLEYTYDAAGNLETITSSNATGTAVSYGYGELNRLSTVTEPGNAPVTYNYDANGNLGGYVYPNGVSTSYTYDALNRLTQMGSARGGQAVSSYGYTLGAAGNRQTVTELSGRIVQYGYDDLYRLTSETIANDPHAINGRVA